MLSTVPYRGIGLLLGLAPILSSAQTVKYEVKEGSLFGITRTDEGGGTRHDVGPLTGACVAEFRLGVEAILLELTSVELIGAAGADFHATGSGRWEVYFDFSSPAPLPNGGLQFGGFTLAIDGEERYVAMPEIGVTIPGLPLLTGFFGGGSISLHLILAPAEDEEHRFFARGDMDGNLARDLSDAMQVLLYLFKDGTEPNCLDAADVGDDGRVDLADAIFLLTHLFMGGRRPPSPAKHCGIDLTEDTIDCQGQPACMPAS